VKTIDRVLLDDVVQIALTPKAGQPVLSGVELQRLDD
jgi:hypothetical protein